MGLGLYIKALRAGRSWTRLFRRSRDLAQELGTLLLRGIADPTLRQLAALHPAEHGVDVQLHPAAEYLELRNESDGACVCSIKTSTCGPGFHAYVVELLQEAGAKLQVQWELEGEFGDETRFWNDQSFERLQREMADMLCHIARSIEEHAGDDANLMVNMPMGFPGLADGGKHAILTPIGPKTGEWLELAAQSPQDAWRLAPGFYPWWNRGLGGDFWRGLGLVLAWGNLSWAAPSNEMERSSYELAQTAFGRAAEAGDDALPTDEIAEIQSLLTASDAKHLPPPDTFPTRIGYRRRRLWRPLTGRWQAALPGYFYVEEEKGGDTVVYWYGDRTVRGSSFTISRKNQSVAPAAEVVGEPKMPNNGTAEMIDERQNDPPRWATIAWTEAEDGAYWMLSGMIGAPNELCLCTICYTNESDRQWALDTWRSIRRPLEAAD